MGFSEPEDVAPWASTEGYAFELWTDDERTLALTYGAILDAAQEAPDRNADLLDGEGAWLLHYDGAVSIGANPEDVLQDCAALFAHGV